MKNEVVIKEGKWVWPKDDESSWEGQNKTKDLYQHILPYVKEKNIMVQAGGNCGFILSHFVDHFNTVYTFEPDPINFYCLNQNIQSSNVIKLQACLGDSNKTVKVQQLVREGRKNDIGGFHVAGSGLIPMFSIDSLKLTGCDLIQLDIEGYELKALEGAINTINQYKPVICVEVFEKWLDRYGDSSTSILELLTSLEYEVVNFNGVDKIFLHKSKLNG
jgi:FkbM family methyltransferase